MPYQIPDGVNYILYLLMDVGIRSKIVYDPKPTADVHPILHKELNPIPQPPLIL